MSDKQSLSKYEIIRNDIIAERKKEWNDLLEAKEDFVVTTKKIKVRRKYKVPEDEILRRSSRIKAPINYTEDSKGMTRVFKLQLHKILLYLTTFVIQ